MLWAAHAHAPHAPRGADREGASGACADGGRGVMLWGAGQATVAGCRIAASAAAFYAHCDCPVDDGGGGGGGLTRTVP
jgi:hypothetical protein